MTCLSTTFLHQLPHNDCDIIKMHLGDILVGNHKVRRLFHVKKKNNNYFVEYKTFCIDVDNSIFNFHVDFNCSFSVLLTDVEIDYAIIAFVEKLYNVLQHDKVPWWRFITWRKIPQKLYEHVCNDLYSIATLLIDKIKYEIWDIPGVDDRWVQDFKVIQISNIEEVY
jgi:hypothetical protein